MFKIVVLLLIMIFVVSCNRKPATLPILGEQTIHGNDTIYPKIADFNFINQDSNYVSNQTFADKIYVADFIFLSCPTICPVMTMEMKKVYTEYEIDDRVCFISHSIDPERDTVSRLKVYAESLGAASNKWHFVTGDQDSIMHLAEHSYYSAAYPDSAAPGGFVHSGGFLLIDKQRHIRGVYNSLRPEETTRLINDVQLLLKEQF